MRPTRPLAAALLAGALVLGAALARAPVALAQDELLAGRIGATIAGLEWLISRKARCERRLALVEQNIATAEQDPVANAELLTQLYERRDTNTRCLATVPERIATEDASLDALAEQFVATTRVERATLDGALAALHEREAVHVEKQFALRKAQSELAQLLEKESPNPTRVAQKEAVVQSAGEDLEAAVAAVAEANRALADLEAGLLAANRTGSATLSWATPTTRENGSPLAPGEIGGFEIYLLSESTGASTVITLSDPLLTSYEVDGLAPDTYHFSIAAYDTDGKFSQLSEVVSKQVP